MYIRIFFEKNRPQSERRNFIYVRNDNCALLKEFILKYFIN